MILLTSLSTFFQCSVMALLLHPMHVSVTDVEFDEKEKSLEIMSRIFIEDLETTMRERLNIPELDIMNPKSQSLDDMMRSYFTEKFSVRLDKKQQTINYLGHEKDGDLFVFYIEVTNVKKWREIEISNTALMETFADQSNMVHVKVREESKSMRLTESNPTDKFSFDLK